MNKFGKKPGDVHFTAEGSALLAEAVAKEIRKNLPKGEAGK